MSDSSELLKTVGALVARANLHGAREVRISPDGVSMTDAIGRTVAMEDAGAPTPSPQSTMAEILEAGDRWSSRGGSADRVWIEGHGEWAVSERNGAVVLRPAKPEPFCLEALAEFSEDALDRLRSLYRRSGVGLIIQAEGETRCRDAILTIARERTMVGLPCQVDAEGASRASWSDRTRIRVSNELEITEKAPLWTFLQLDPRTPPAGEADVVARPVRPYQGLTVSNRPEEAARKLDGLDRPAVLIDIRLEDSKPIGRVIFSSSAFALSSDDPDFPDPPWRRFVERRNARRASAPAKAKTWHSTTAQVARAFVARSAPRGLISGRSLYFHGPVAFSQWFGNPIAVFMKTTSGEQVLLQGRNQEQGGTAAGTTSSAQGDIRAAADGKTRVIELDADLTGLVSIDGQTPGDAARTAGWKKTEANLPKHGRIETAGLTVWLLKRSAELRREQVDADRTPFPTFRKAQVLGRMAELASARDRLASLFGVDLPVVGDADELGRRAKDAYSAARERTEAKSRTRAAAPAP